MLEVIGAILGLVFIIIVFVPYLCIASVLMWEVLIYPFWKGVFDWARGSLGKVKNKNG